MLIWGLDMKKYIFVILVFVLVFMCGRSDAAIEEAPDFLGKLNSKEYEGTKYFYYIPETANSRRKTALRTLVLVHGKDSAADAFVEMWAEVAEKIRVAIVAPVFDSRVFPDYNGLNIQGPRADLKLLEIIKDANSIWPINTEKFYIYGHSAGAQFAHRFAMVHPERIVKGVASAAGNYTFPDANVPYLYGIKQTEEANDIKFDVDAFAQLKFAVIVGALDTDPNVTDGTDAQGKNRAERAWKFYRAMKKHAENNDIASKLRFAKIPKVGHDFRGTTPWSEQYLFGYKRKPEVKREEDRESRERDERRGRSERRGERDERRGRSERRGRNERGERYERREDN